ncbi:CopG family ribbon-helix-helix protein [Rhizobium sp. TH2]|uniref:CopG family ribbon-helix-helix protein n=1 Tax=Rhizobium sp. TH2 TaxID=2775403 RepID=UPI002158792B|nr:CopG family ribbon-helix-helix protein [Rhizobium sp. TH2]UVC07821.1 CopG family ribbon-helix-helix protein [Rhizobium sp. TH2]
MANSPFSLRLSPDLKERLDAVAESEDRSASYVATKAIEAFLDSRDSMHAAVKAAIEEADKGVFVSSEAVDRWMESWGTDNELPMPEPDVFLDPSRK